MDTLQGSAKGKILGLDYGEARIGIAISDELRMVARAVSTLPVAGNQTTLKNIVEFARKLEATAVVVGLPKNMDGSQGAGARKVRAFAEKLGQVLSLPIALIDERLSTIEAEEHLKSNVGGRSRRARRRRKDPGKDAYAAKVILQRYLDGE